MEGVMEDTRQPPKTGAEARAKGITYYYTGIPCIRGHVANRAAVNGNCYDCDKMKAILNRQKYKKRRTDYLLKNKDKIAAQEKAWRKLYKQKYKLRIREQRHNYYVRAKEYITKKRKEWTKNNQDKVLAYSQARRARKRKAPGRFTPSQVAHLFALQRGKCASCFCSIRQGYQVDHVMPLALRGSNYIENIQLLCQPCNHTKSAKHPLEWAMENGRLL